MLNEINTIPGWTFQGTVQYVTAGQTIALPDNGHAIQLGQDGKINQTIKADADFMNYILTFTLAPGGQNCSANADLVVSGPDNQGVFSFKQHYGEETWLSYGQYLGLGGQEEPINLVFESQAVESDDNSTCWPVIDSLLVKSVGTLVQGNAISPVQSPLRQWAVVGTIKYIDSKHFFVPYGNAAVELVSGVSTGTQTEVTLTAGDANSACEGDFTVEVRAGSIIQNFSVRSNGTGSAHKSSMKFEPGSHPTPLSFISYTTSQTKNGIFCGPVVDDVVLLSSYGPRIAIKRNILISLLFLICRKQNLIPVLEVENINSCVEKPLFLSEEFCAITMKLEKCQALQMFYTSYRCSLQMLPPFSVLSAAWSRAMLSSSELHV
ncbi:uncharacterized protein LOC111300925 [Durio zibethinus]|uniref:Uncharacterized protein LOC111300925 n=1 Tax=Durio zibethinus TaxID=66656 RepID=A0A6P5ZHL8_DURZI|nr:uncharacterized protein LOC111300925 [Durio zibethinus]